MTPPIREESATTLPMTIVPGNPVSMTAAPSSPIVPIHAAAPACPAADTIAAGVLVDQPRAISRSAIAARWLRPISTTSVAAPGVRLSTTGPNALSAWPDTIDDRRGHAAMRDGDARELRRRDHGAHARHDVHRDAGGAQREDFLAAAPEHEGVAALEADDVLSAPRAANHQPMDRVLADGMAVVALADVEPLRATRQLDDGGRHERVVEHEIGAAQDRQRPARQQPGIARPRAHQRHAALHERTSPA